MYNPPKKTLKIIPTNAKLVSFSKGFCPSIGCWEVYLMTWKTFEPVKLSLYLDTVSSSLPNFQSLFRIEMAEIIFVNRCEEISSTNRCLSIAFWWQSWSNQSLNWVVVWLGQTQQNISWQLQCMPYWPFVLIDKAHNILEANLKLQIFHP